MRVATYNVHKCQGLDRRTKAGRIAEVIAEVNPDVIGLQEVLSIEDGGREQNQAQFLADELGMHLAIGEVRRLQGGIYGNVVLSKFPLEAHCTFDLSIPGREQRGCLRTDVSVPQGPTVHLFNVHLGTGFLERRQQARKLLDAELIRCGNPRVVLGDFNEWTRGHVSHALAAEFTSADIRVQLRKSRTYPGVFPFLHLDHIYYDEGLVVESVALHRTKKALVASDHLPLFVDFELSDKLKGDDRSSRHAE